MDFGGKDYKSFGLDGHTFDRRCIFLFKEGDNNYSIPVIIAPLLGYTSKVSL